MSVRTVASNAAKPNTPGAIADVLPKLTFLVEIPGLQLGQFTECSGIGVQYDVVEYEEGGNNQYVHQLRVRSRYPTLALRRGFTSQDALLTWFYGYQKETQRPTLTVTMLDNEGDAIRRFAFAGAYPLRWKGPDVTAGSTAASTESLDVGHTGMVSS